MVNLGYDFDTWKLERQLINYLFKIDLWLHLWGIFSIPN